MNTRARLALWSLPLCSSLPRFGRDFLASKDFEYKFKHYVDLTLLLLLQTATAISEMPPKRGKKRAKSDDDDNDFRPTAEKGRESDEKEFGEGAEEEVRESAESAEESRGSTSPAQKKRRIGRKAANSNDGLGVERQTKRQAQGLRVKLQTLCGFAYMSLLSIARAASLPQHRSPPRSGRD